jgi:hypothetical protein
MVGAFSNRVGPQLSDCADTLRTVEVYGLFLSRAFYYNAQMEMSVSQEHRNALDLLFLLKSEDFGIGTDRSNQMSRTQQIRQIMTEELISRKRNYTRCIAI